jgi:hypothetical protein
MPGTCCSLADILIAGRVSWAKNCRLGTSLLVRVVYPSLGKATVRVICAKFPRVTVSGDLSGSELRPARECREEIE